MIQGFNTYHKHLIDIFCRYMTIIWSIGVGNAMKKTKKEKNIYEWPRPNPIPRSSIVLLFINIAALYFILDHNVSFYWILPSFIINLFFFNAEKSIYFREKRNFDGWTDEMEASIKKPTSQEIWIKNINSVRRRRKSSISKQRKRHEWIETMSTAP